MNCTYGKSLCNISSPKCHKPVLILAISWVCSIVVGAYLAFSAQDLSSSLMHAVLINRVSIVGLATILFFPFILSALAAYFSLPELIYVIAVVKGVCLGFTTITLLLYYTGAAWLVHSLACFSSSFALMPLFLCWIRCLTRSGKSLLRDTYRYLIYSVVIGLVDYLYVSPLVCNVI